MSKYFFYQMNEELERRMDLPHLAYPVRKEKALGFIFEGRLSIGKLLDELDSYLEDHPGQKGLYSDAMVKLAWLEGLEAGRKGYMEHAVAYFRLGLDYQPANLSLHAELAAALLSLNRREESLDELELLIREAGSGVEPLVWLLAARLHQEFGHHGRATELLRELVLL